MAYNYNLPWLQQGNNMESVPEWMYPYLQQTSWYQNPYAQQETQAPATTQGMFGGSGDDTGLVPYENPVPMTYEEQKADWAKMTPAQEMFLSFIPGAMSLGNAYYDRPWDAGIYGGFGGKSEGLFGGIFDGLFGNSNTNLIGTGSQPGYWDNYSSGMDSSGYTDMGGYGYDTYDVGGNYNVGVEDSDYSGGTTSTDTTSTDSLDDADYASGMAGEWN